MKQSIVLSLFFLVSLLISSFDISLENNLNPYQKSLIELEGKIKELAREKKYDSAINFSKKLLKLSHQLKDSTYIANSNFRLGFYHKKLDQYEEAFSHYNEAFKIYVNFEDSIQSANMLRSMANIQKGLGDFLGSQQTSLDGLRFLTKSKDLNKISGLYHIISVSLKEQGDLVNALKWNEKALSLTKSYRIGSISPRNLITYTNTKANILTEQKEFSTSIEIFQSLLKDTLVLQSKHEYARILTNLGRTHWLNDSKNLKTESLLLNSLEIRKNINSISGLISSNIHLCNYYSNTNPKKALFFAENAVLNAKKLKNAVSILEALDLIIPLKKKLDIELKEEAILYSKTRNELSKIQQRIRSIYATTKYDNDKLTNDNLTLETEKAQKDRQNILYLSAFTLSLLGLGFLAYFKNHQKKKAELEVKYQTEIRIAKKIHDEVGNDLFYLMTQIKNKPELLQKDNGFVVLEGLDKVYQKARDISKEYTPIRTDETFGEELMSLLNSYGNESIKIITNQLDRGFWNLLSKNKKIELFWIVRELMTNMRKYSKASFVGITFGKVGNNLEFNYTDDGIGFMNTQNNWGNGLRHVETRIQKLNGSFNFDSEPSKGVTARIKFPI